MKNTFGQHLAVTLFGESHGPAIGVVLDGLCPGLPVEEEAVAAALALRRPAGDTATARVEPDRFEIVSGVFEGKTTGTPLCLIIPNENTRSGDYQRGPVRPGHADFAAFAKYGGYEDYRGGGHFSGRITAALVAAGGLAASFLAPAGVQAGSHIYRCGPYCDAPFLNPAAELPLVANNPFPLLRRELEEPIKERIRAARAAGDSVGGVVETAVVGLPAGVGEPWFDTVEGLLSHALFSVPAVKGVEFGDGFAAAERMGSEVNDPLRLVNGRPQPITNHNGGVNGGITNGLPVVFRCAVKPTPSIARVQQTVDLLTGQETDLQIGGRHDPAIFHRACAVINAVTILTVYDLLCGRFGTDFLRGGAAWNTV